MLPIISSTISENEKVNFNLNTDFLRKIPVNDYILGSGDLLKISVSRELPLLTTITRVDGEGTIILPRLKRIFVKGLTIDELVFLLNDQFREYINFPDVEVEVPEYRPVSVFVGGEVSNPGIQILKGSFNFSDSVDSLDIKSLKVNNQNKKRAQVNFFPTLFDAIRQSGGITEYTDLSNIQIIRQNSISGGGGRITTTLNFEQILTSGQNSQNIRIYDGDIIKIGKKDKPNFNILGKAILSNLNPKFIDVFVAGRVNIPGYLTLSRASVLSDAVEMAGGAKVLKGPLTFIRFNNDGSIDKRKFSYRRGAKRGSFKNPNLNNGDLIIIGESAFSIVSEITKEFTAPFVGLYSGYSLFEAILD
tara:strand:- start:2277 stop:3359 length:1083 start_codon:yes stop_codon:yes gene_type:complete